MLDKPVGWNVIQIVDQRISYFEAENSEIEESSVERWSWWCYCSIVQRIDEEVDELLSLRSMDSTFSTMVNGLRICFICNSLRIFFVSFFFFRYSRTNYEYFCHRDIFITAIWFLRDWRWRNFKVTTRDKNIDPITIIFKLTVTEIEIE